jgi:hypothetical protein
MSYYTKFADVEALLTSTTTGTVIASTDAVLITSVSGGRPFQTTPGQIGCIQSVSTTSSTATTLPNYGLSFIPLGTAGTSATAWLLADPTAKGLVKTVYFSSTTSTANLVTVVSTGVTTIVSTGGSANTSVTVQGSGAGGFTLEAMSTTVWVLTSKIGTIATS